MLMHTHTHTHTIFHRLTFIYLCATRQRHKRDATAAINNNHNNDLWQMQQRLKPTTFWSLLYAIILWFCALGIVSFLFKFKMRIYISCRRRERVEQTRGGNIAYTQCNVSASSAHLKCIYLNYEYKLRKKSNNKFACLQQINETKRTNWTTHCLQQQ